MRSTRRHSSTSFIISLIVLGGTFAPIQRASAQADALAGLLSRVTAVNAYGIFGQFHPKPASLATRRTSGDAKREGLSGYGLEFSFQVADLYQERGEFKPDTTRKLTSLVVKKAAGSSAADSTYTMEVEIGRDRKQDRRVGLVELALGYSQVSGFYSTNPSIDLRGSLRELPSLSLYVTVCPDNPLSPYFGLRSGLIQLHHTRLYDSTAAATGPGAVYSVDAQAFQAGPVAGAALEIKSINLFAEGSYLFRNFPSLDIKAESNIVPSQFPRALNFSGYYFQAGIQIEIGKSEK
jgi:hypothetical protein